MKKFFKYALILLGLDVLLFILLALKPAPDAIQISDCLEVTGLVTKVSNGTTGDLIITLAGDDRQYFINDLLAAEDESIEKWNKILSNKQVSLYHPKYWTPLEFAEDLRRLKLVEVEGKAVWGEPTK